MEFLNNFSQPRITQNCDNIKETITTQLRQYHGFTQISILIWSTLALSSFLASPHIKKYCETKGYEKTYKAYDWANFLLQKGFLIYMFLLSLQSVFT